MPHFFYTNFENNMKFGGVGK